MTQNCKTPAFKPYRIPKVFSSAAFLGTRCKTALSHSFFFSQDLQRFQTEILPLTPQGQKGGDKEGSKCFFLGETTRTTKRQAAAFASG